jgi:hypothetical protein
MSFKNKRQCQIVGISQYAYFRGHCRIRNIFTSSHKTYLLSLFDNTIYLLSLHAYSRGNLLQDKNLWACLQYFCQLHHFNICCLMENYTYTVYDSWNADSLNSSPQSWLLLYAATYLWISFVIQPKILQISKKGFQITFGDSYLKTCKSSLQLTAVPRLHWHFSSAVKNVLIMICLLPNTLKLIVGQPMIIIVHGSLWRPSFLNRRINFES